MAPKCKSSHTGNSNILLLTYKLSFIISLYADIGKKQSIYTVLYYVKFQAPTGGLATYAPQTRGPYAAFIQPIKKCMSAQKS